VKAKIKIELESCPFCGGRAYVNESVFGSLLLFRCAACGATISFDNDTCNKEPIKAIEYFNKRSG
jgi:hypothetical protein